MTIYTATDVCRELGIVYQKLLYDERMKYIPEPRRTASRIRYYTKSDLDRLRENFDRREILESELSGLKESGGNGNGRV